jgi:hypothetical protein
MEQNPEQLLESVVWSYRELERGSPWKATFSQVFVELQGIANRVNSYIQAKTNKA